MSRDPTSANLDLLRSVAVVTVMLDHLIPTLGYHGVAVPAVIRELTDHLGQAGVLAFFVHTSLVLMYSLERMAARAPVAVTARFYLRRFFRIYPLAIACVLAVIAFGLPDATWRAPAPVTGPEVAANLMLVQNVVTGHSVLVPLWSLPYEVEMYLVLPALYFVARRVGGARWIGGLLAALCVGGYALAELDGGRLNLVGYAPCFLAGVLAYALRERARPIAPGGAWWLFVVGLVATYCLVHRGHDRAVYWVGWLYCVVLALAIGRFGESRNRALNWIALRVATWSYGLYLLHVPVLYIVYDRWRPDSVVGGVIAYVALTFAAAALVFRAIESPLIRLGRRCSEPRAATS